MKPSLKTRKPIDELRIADVDAFPVWEFATDEEGNEDQDETWVRPMRVKQIPSDAYSLLVSANFTAPNGAKYKGIVGVSTAAGFEARYGRRFKAGARRRERARRKAKDLFPLSYRLAVRVEGEAALREGVYSYDKSDA